MKIRISVKKLINSKGNMTVNADTLKLELNEETNDSIIKIVSEALIRKNETLIAKDSITISEESDKSLKENTEVVLKENESDGEPLTVKRRLGK